MRKKTHTHIWSFSSPRKTALPEPLKPLETKQFIRNSNEKAEKLFGISVKMGWIKWHNGRFWKIYSHSFSSDIIQKHQRSDLRCSHVGLANEIDRRRSSGWSRVGRVRRSWLRWNPVCSGCNETFCIWFTNWFRWWWWERFNWRKDCHLLWRPLNMTKSKSGDNREWFELNGLILALWSSLRLLKKINIRRDNGGKLSIPTLTLFYFCSIFGLDPYTFTFVWFWYLNFQ